MSNFYTAGAAAMTSNKDDWETPQKLFDQLNEEFHFTLDAASSDQNAKCEHHYTASNSGLEHSWEGETVFCNPPYGRNIGDWIRKASQGGQQAEHARSPTGARTHRHPLVPKPYTASRGSPIPARTIEVRGGRAGR
ncbi:DNA N-6-adenine-methyltransferase [Bifidobacterium longum]